MDSNKKNGELEDVKVNVKLKISALWVAMLFVFAYVDIFSLQRPGIIQDILAGKMFLFQINQTFLFTTTLYILIPSIMVFLSLVLKAKVNRWVNIIIAIFYFVSILGGCIGETWAYYLVGSAIECIMLIGIIVYAWKWPKQ